MVFEKSERQAITNRETMKMISLNNRDISELSRKMDEKFSELLNSVTIGRQQRDVK